MRDDGQTDFLGSLWAVVSGTVTAESGRDTVAVDELQLPGGPIRVRYVRHVRARRYRLLFRRDGTARCTVPRRGTLRDARRFVAANEAWLAEKLRRHRETAGGDGPLRPGGMVWLQGREVPLEPVPGKDAVQFGTLEVPWPGADGDLRPAVERALRELAASDLPVRVRAFAEQHGLAAKISGISIRNQRTRWGSCSARGRICLNWRLVQVPEFVRDYVILHELAHLVHLNHGPRFWALVRTLCPEFESAEVWLKRSGRSVF